MVSENYKHNQQFHYNPKKRIFGVKTLIVLTFLVVLGVIIFTSLYGGINLTGHFTKAIDEESLIGIKASLSDPSINLKGEYEEIIFLIEKDSYLELDNQKIYFEESESKLVLRNFNGEIKIENERIMKLEGRTSEIVINNVPISSQGRKSKVNLLSESKFKLFEIKENVYFRSHSFETSGSVSFNEDLINLKSEKLYLENYLGGIKISEGNLVLEGGAQLIRIEGENRKLVLSK